MTNDKLTRNVYIILYAGFQHQLVSTTSRDMGVSHLVLPLGALTVATSIKNSKNFREKDKVFISHSFDEVCRLTESYVNDRIYFLVSSVQIMENIRSDQNFALQCHKDFKKLYPDIYTVVGGPDISMDRESYLGCFDLVFEGEIGDIDLIDVIKSGCHHYVAEKLLDINSEIVDYELLADKKYLLATIQTTRGCPGNCDFCNLPYLFGRKIRSIDESTLNLRLESLLKVHKGFVIVADDNFGGGEPGRITGLLDAIIKFQKKHGYPFAFIIQVSISISNHPALLKKLREANIICVFIGIESPSRDVLVSVGKKQNLSRALEDQVDAFIQHGILPFISFILGLDREPEDIVDQFKKLINRSGTPLMLINMICPRVQTKYRAKLEKEGRLLTDPFYFDNSLLLMKPSRGYSTVIDDYIHLTRWFYSSRRILGYCSGIISRIKKNRDRKIDKKLMKNAPLALVLKGLGVYLYLCFKSKTFLGLIHFFKIIFNPKEYLVYSLILYAGALGLKTQTVGGLPKMVSGMQELRKQKLYPFCS